MYALVDCNNFYVSCERVFNPCLNNKPVVVLSNNDGCIIARSNEAKALDIPMGAPLHLYKDIIKRNNVIVYSSNYTLYGDMSSRVMDSFHYFVSDFEVYSIDEAFLQLDVFDNDNVYTKMLNMKRIIYQWTGIPVSIGIGPTKTLAKLANKIAKKHSNTGVYQVAISDQLSQILSELDMQDIWGISKGWTSRLKKIGINTPLQLQRSDPRQIRQCISVVGERIVYELRGIPNLGADEVTSKKSITVSRSLKKMVENLSDLKKILANHISRAAEKLRNQKALCGGLCVFINTNKFRKNDLQYSNVGMITFSEPTNNTPIIIGKGFQILQSIYRPKYNYKKIGVTLIDLKPYNKLYTLRHLKDKMLTSEKYVIQGDLFNLNGKNQQLSDIMMELLDSINDKMGSGTLFYGSLGIKKNVKKNYKKITSNNRGISYFKSKSYTTSWDQLLEVR